jgi:hypothetical protein
MKKHLLVFFSLSSMNGKYNETAAHHFTIFRFGSGMKWNPGSGNNQSPKSFFMRKTFGQESLQLHYRWGWVILVVLYIPSRLVKEVVLDKLWVKHSEYKS